MRPPGSLTAATSALRHAQALAVLDSSRALPQGDGRAWASVRRRRGT